MGHLASKGVYSTLRERLDRYPVGAPGETTIYEILKILFTPEEAALAAKLPLRFESLKQVARRLGLSEAEAEPRLAAMADKGMVFDLKLGARVMYMLTPTMVGLFEFTLMRVREDIDQPTLAKLMHQYVVQEPDFVRQFLTGVRTTPFRALVHEEVLADDVVEVLDWERASEVVGNAGRWGVGLCHCRHVAHHRGADCEKFEMETCMTLGWGVDYVTRHGMAREISKEEALDILARSRDAGLVHLLDNVKRSPTYLCNCCSCCCEALSVYKRAGVDSSAFSSNYLARVEASGCTGCRRCEKACPVDAISMIDDVRTVKGKRVKRLAMVDEAICIGCGVCALACKDDALAMADRPERRIPPEGAVARMMSAAIDRGTFQNLLVDPDGGFTARAANTFLRAILRLPPAKQLLARDELQSRFVNRMIGAAKKGGMKGLDL
jgi:ferredoxin